MLHIGIVACSTEGAALCYRTISLEGSQRLGRYDHPEVSLHSYPLVQYMKHIERGDWAGVAELMTSSAEKLARGGADFLICPDNTIHQAFDLIEHRSPRPWLHIGREVAREA
jgi:aspartate racemase